MKKLNLFQLCLLSLFILCGVALVFAQISKHPRGITMNIKEVENKYGKQDFESKKFKNGNLKIRASMATSLIQNKVLIGKTNAEIFQLLGYGDGYYFSDLIPAYLIEDNSKKDGDVWQIVFILDRNSKVKSIHVHKNGSNLLQ